ncbi:leukotriene B4 receptor 1-like isoform X1 [Notothenia coriiceps]|uniref:Leukotriene B4 receptor 1-like isoform X1 n=1 Tax=Notothenia coriiceps TaxID=8208 RepID=A0A6I9Q279_9TELE|nr:PREDICTED: leukotriene B4 receptor 1-like isoform X1 [Notothenia coriiceps]
MHTTIFELCCFCPHSSKEKARELTADQERSQIGLHLYIFQVDLPSWALKEISSKAFLMASNITTTISQQSSFASVPLSVNAMVGIAILTLAFVLGFPGNLFVVWTVLCRVKNRSVTGLLVLNLSMADAFVLLSAPLFLRYLAGGRGWEFGSAACKLVHYLSSVNMYMSIYLICLMSMDRWLAVSRPFLFKTMRTKRSLLILLLVVWVLALLLPVPMPFYRRLDMRSTFPNNITLSFCVPYHWKSKGHRVFQYLFETIMAFLLPFSLINTCYSSVICRLQSAKFQRRAQGSRLILMIICTFAVFWLPYHIVNIIEVVGVLQDSKSAVTVALAARPNVTAFAYFSSAVNPMLYVFAGSSHIRQAGFSFMGKLFEATSSKNRTMSTFTRSEHINRRCSTPDERSALNTLSMKLGRMFKSKEINTGGSVAGKEADEFELRTLAIHLN